MGVLKISEITEPTIGSTAAMTSIAAELCVDTASTSGMLWVFALLAVSVVVAVNFCMALHAQKEWEWLPELLLLIPMIILWYCLDTCHEALWFPLALLKVNLVLFAIYLYLFEKKEL